MMMDDTNGASPAPGLSQSPRIPIAQISPATESISQGVIHATVSLLWPYSSSTKSLSLLLAEPDFRLRRSNGQVKIVFNGSIAESVAASKIGIGDDVYLCLEGTRFVNNEAATQTPGKCVTWDLHFDDRVQLEVFRNAQRVATVKVNPSSSPLPSIRVTSPTPVTPTPKNNSAIDGVAPATNAESWQSPAFMGRSRTSFGVLVDSAFDPFAEEDGYVPGKGRKRARFSMRGSDWRVIDEPESPGEKDIPVDWFHIFDEEEANASDADEEITVHAEEAPSGSPKLSNDSAPDHEDMDISEPTTTTEPPPAPAEPAKDDVFRPPDRQNIPSLRSRFPIDTPRLHPIPSPGLPIPSPLVTTPNNQQGYFGSVGSASHSQIGPVSAIASQDVAQQDINASHVLSQTSQFESYGHSEPAPEGAHLGQDTGGSEVSIATEAIQFKEVTAATEETVENDQSSGIVEAETLREIENDEMEVDNTDDHEGGEVRELYSEVRQETIAEGSEEKKDEDESQESDLDGVHEGVGEDEEREQGADFDSPKHRATSTAESIESGEGEDSEAAGSVDEPVHPLREERAGLTSEHRHLSDEEYEYSSQSEDDQKRVEDEDEDEEDEEDEDEDEMEQEVLYGAGRRERRQSVDDDEYDERDEYESEYESDQMSVENDVLPPPTTHPEVIVLDSDSEDDTAPSRPTPLTEQRERPAKHGRQSSEEGPVSGESFTGSEAEDWEDDDSRQEEYAESELGKVEAEAVDESSEDEHAESKLEKMEAEAVDDSRENEYVESELEEEHQPEAELVQPFQQNEGMESGPEEEQRVDAESHVQLVEDRHSEAENVVDEWPEDENVKGQPISDEHVEDEQMVDAHPHQIFHVEETALGGLPEDNEGGYDVQVHYQDDIGNNTRPASPPHQEAFGHDAFVPSTDQPQAASESLQHDVHMAIDPELYNLGPVQDVNDETQLRQHEEQVEPSAEKVSVDMEHEKEDQAALSMDGASAPPRLSQDLNDASGVLPSPLQHGQPFMTPEPSQSVDVNNDAPVELATTEMPPTPLHTQEASAQEKELLQSLQVTGTVPAISAEDINPELEKVPDNTDVTHASRESPQQSVEMSVHETEEPASPEDPKQTHIIIDDDDSLGTIDSVHLVSVDRHYPGLRSKLSYFAPLATLIDHFNSLTDTISVVSEVHPIIEATKRKDYLMTLELTDPSMAGTTLNAQITRPYKGALPTPEEGDSILLRNFKVRSFDHSMMLVSGETSSWAVFSRSKVGAQVDGPPVEYGAEEQTHATDLRQWYQETGMAMVADFQLQASIDRASREVTPASSAILSDSGSIDSVLRDVRGDSSVSARSSRRRKSHRRITIHELRDGRRYTEVGSPSGKDSIHELRDGTVYANI